MGATLIYGLCDPRSGEVRYVGKADYPKRRLGGHITCAKRANSSTYNTYAGNWIRSLLAIDLKPMRVALEWVFVEEWEEREQWWIDFLTNIGCRLVNTTDGGMGGPSRIGKKWSPEHRIKMMAAIARRKSPKRGPYSAEVRQAISEGLKRNGVKPPPHAYEKALQTNRGKPAWNRGKKMSSETRQKLSAMRIGNTFTLGHKNSPEVCERKRQAQLRRYARERESRQG
jgi:hypothetical protein